LMEGVRVGARYKAAADHCDIQSAFGFGHALGVGTTG